MDQAQLHNLLQRQIRKYLPADLLSDPAVAEFIHAVNTSFLNFERDKDLSEHVATLHEQEYLLINQQLKEEADIRRKSVEKLAEAIRSLDIPEGYVPPVFSADNMLGLVTFLKRQIAYQKQIESELILAKEAAESATKAKSEFLSVMSHEIRTPLNAIVGLIYLMKQEQCPPAVAESLDTLQFAADNLYVLINDILDFSKIEAGKIELEYAPFDLKQLIFKIQKSHLAKAAENGNTIILEIDEGVPDLMEGDALRLSQIVANLVSNAVKFTHNGYITIRLQLLQLHNGIATIRLSVKDTGIGIPEAQHQRIFESFTQASSKTTRRYGGTGLGLAISRRLLQLYQSDIELESRPGEGSTFSFVLRLKVLTPHEPQPEVTPSSPTEKNMLEGVKLLLVEDYPVNIKVAGKFFERWKIDFDVAENGAIGVEKAAQNQYDLILMDIQMPEMDGYTATRQIRTFNPLVPIIALTASATSDDEASIFEAGMNDIVFKPFIPQDLLEKIARYSGRKP